MHCTDHLHCTSTHILYPKEGLWCSTPTLTYIPSNIQHTNCYTIPPNLLSPKKLTQQQFDIWSAEFQAWLGRDTILSYFLPDRLYPTWEYEEVNQHRIEDLAEAYPDIPQHSTANQRTALFTKWRRLCLIFLSQVDKCVSENHFIPIMVYVTLL